MEENIMITIETILDKLDIDLKNIQEEDATEIVSIILVYMIYEANKKFDNEEVQISDMLWTEQS